MKQKKTPLQLNFRVGKKVYRPVVAFTASPRKKGALLSETPRTKVYPDGTTIVVDDRHSKTLIAPNGMREYIDYASGERMINGVRLLANANIADAYLKHGLTKKGRKEIRSTVKWYKKEMGFHER